MKVIGLTGGIACGKSSVGNILRNLGVKVIDADEIAHQLYRPGTSSHSEIVKEFGSRIVGAHGEINRQKLGEIVFNDKQARLKLENLIHPRIVQRIKESIGLAKMENRELLVVEVPLLFEAGLEDLFDYIWVVSAQYDLQVGRLMKRNNLTRKEADNRLMAQLPLNYKEGKADAVIYNNGELDVLEAEVRRLLEMTNPNAVF